MRFVLFGTATQPVLQTLSRLKFHQVSEGYVVEGNPEDINTGIKEKYIRKMGGHYIVEPAKVSVLSKDVVYQLVDGVDHLLPNYIDIVKQGSSEIEVAYLQTYSSKVLNLPWVSAQDILVYGWMMDMGVSFQAALENRRLNHTWHVIAFESYPNNVSDCGIRLQGSDSLTFGEFWASDRIKNPNIPINLTSEDLNSLTLFTLPDNSANPLEYIPPRVGAKLIYFGIVSRIPNSTQVRLQVPLFTKNEYLTIEAIILKWANQIVNFCNLWLGISGFNDSPIYRLAFYRLLLTSAYTALREPGLPTGVRTHVARSWGLWLMPHAPINPILENDIKVMSV
jgi:hypothetical protein